MTAPPLRLQGPPVDPSPARPPGPAKLIGRYGTVERFSAARHGLDLWDAMRGRDDLWTYLPVGPFGDLAGFRVWLAAIEKSPDPYFYAIVQSDGRAVGLAALMAIRPDMRVIEVGHIVYGAPLQRTPLATEAQFLLARYVFETLGYRRYEWKCNALNEPSFRAALRFGFTHEGVFRQHMIVKGRSRDTAWFAMLEGEWPSRKAAFERWLAPENFDVQGRQMTSLVALREAPLTSRQSRG
jgi:RimJ/RimL family protein N-acetyltransferase